MDGYGWRGATPRPQKTKAASHSASQKLEALSSWGCATLLSGGAGGDMKTQVMRVQAASTSSAVRQRGGVGVSSARRPGLAHPLAARLPRPGRQTKCRATKEPGAQESFDENINPFCSLDETGKPVKKKKVRLSGTRGSPALPRPSQAGRERVLGLTKKTPSSSLPLSETRTRE